MQNLLRHFAHPVKLQGPILEAPLANVFIGELCLLRASLEDRRVIGRAQVVGFREHLAILSLMGQSNGLSRQCVLMPTGQRLTVDMSTGLLGCILDASGHIQERMVPEEPVDDGEMRALDSAPPSFAQRAPINEPLFTGVRAIDSLLTCGEGQRIGIFAAAGSGKTSLMNMLIEHTDADVFVIGLVGERGRELAEFIHELRQTNRCARSIVVYATSDQSSVDRCNAALLATTLAEYFRDLGARVVLLVDSMTRYARALRDVALAAGEMPARRGYPASVFDALPRLLERPGKTDKGSITAFYTVLLESEDEVDPIGEEIRSILDGHIYLSRKLANKGHFPAIDVLGSISRLFPQVTTPKHQEIAQATRTMLSRLEEMQIYLDLGEYHAGENPENDKVMGRRAALERFLRQDMRLGSDPQETLKGLHAIVA